jgi:hypothetical protein
VKGCLPPKWYSFFMGRYDDLSAAVWSCQAEDKPRAAGGTFDSDEDAWFKEGENLVHESPEE